jgi:hypothetical protein
MHRDEFRAIVTEQVQRSLAENKAVITAVPDAQLQPLITAIADGVFAALETALDEAPAAVVAPVPPSAGGPPVMTSAPGPMRSADPTSESLAEEVPLWRGRPYLTIGTIYELTSQRLRIIRGIVSNQIEEIELVRVRDTNVKQNVGERMFDIGDITVVSGDASSPTKVLYNVRNPVEVRELIRKAVFDERERRGLRYREEMQDEFDDIQT